jgi:hypothetical protein
MMLHLQYLELAARSCNWLRHETASSRACQADGRADSNEKLKKTRAFCTPASIRENQNATASSTHAHALNIFDVYSIYMYTLTLTFSVFTAASGSHLPARWSVARIFMRHIDQLRPSSSGHARIDARRPSLRMLPPAAAGALLLLLLGIVVVVGGGVRLTYALGS